MKFSKIKNDCLLAAAALTVLEASSAVVAYYPLDIDSSGMVTEIVSGNRFEVAGLMGAESTRGAKGEAMYLDGYSSYVGLGLNSVPVTTNMSVRLWVAVQSYPICEVDSPDPGRQAAIVSCIDDEARTGFGFFLGFDGQYSFQVYVGGEKKIVSVSRSLPRYKWNCLTAVVNGDDGKLELFNNRESVGTVFYDRGKHVNMQPTTIHVGQDTWEKWFGDNELDRFRTSAFGGVLDELTIYNEVLSLDNIHSTRAEAAPVLTVPAGRYASDRWHPRFHGCPSGNWTNETHGLIMADGRYHLFFQKNAMGPYMARLHWGHLSSANLYDWQEERIALTPGEPGSTPSNERFALDMKGCWSGCVFTDDELTGGRPAILYTGVDYGRARIFRANPVGQDNALLSWNKDLTPQIDGRHPILSDDFRDPYFYRHGNKALMVVGGSREGRSALALYTWQDGRWNPHPDDTAYWGWDVAADGVFMEMPVMIEMPGGKWLMAYSPLGTSEGVKSLYRTGSIDDQGRFLTDGASTTSRTLDLFGRDGYGMLSPSLMKLDDKVVAIGIVPDKLGGYDSKLNGWAHCYSLPREWRLNADGELYQKAASQLEGLRSGDGVSRQDFNLRGSYTVPGVSGREAEVRATYTCSNAAFGIKFFKNPSNPDHSYAALTINPADHTVAIDLRHLPRIVNDGYPYGGLYQATLPADIAPGKEVTVDLFIDRSVVDLFVNDHYAASVRVYPHDLDGLSIETYAEGDTRVKTLEAWNLDSHNAVIPSGAIVSADASPTNRMAILIAENSVDNLNAQEKAAVDLFKTLYPAGAVVTPSEAAAELKIEKYGTVWVHVDRIGVGLHNLPASMADQKVIDALRDYYITGGNLMLTQHATQLVTMIDRIDARFHPGLFSDGDGAFGSDTWTVQAQIGWWQLNPDNGNRDLSQYYDRRSHPIYAGMTTSAIYPWESFAMEGTGDDSSMWREDHNCCWDLNAYGYNAEGRNTVERFERENNCQVLGTWGHVQDYAVAGIIEFLPAATGAQVTSQHRRAVASATGRIIANGLAACELAPRYGDNLYASNVQRLHANTLSYLAAHDNGPVISAADEVETDMDAPVVYPVNGSRIGYRGAEPGETMTVVSTDGRMLLRHTLTESEGVVSVNHTGVVVVTIGREAWKLLIK